MKEVFTAEWVLPVCDPPIRDGFVRVENGKIRAVGHRSALTEPAPEPLPGSLITPGLVNTHIHLEQSFETPVSKGPEESFTDWLLKVRARNNTPEAIANKSARCRFGVAELLGTGTTCVNDIASGAESLQALDEAGLRGAVSMEFFSPGPFEVLAEALAGFIQRFDGFSRAYRDHPRLRVGLSPHSAYNVSASAWQSVAKGCGNPPIHTHVAEFEAETGYLKGEESEVRHMHRTILGQAFSPGHPAESPVRFLKERGLLKPGLVAAHLIETDDHDRNILHEAGICVSHCPRSNLNLHGKTLRYADWAETDIPMGLGTDGRLSVENLDLRAEARMALGLHGWSAQEALAFCTRHGAQVMGLTDQVGTLAGGKQADLVIWRAKTLADANPEALWLDPATSVVAVYVDGVRRWTSA